MGQEMFMGTDRTYQSEILCWPGLPQALRKCLPESGKRE